MPITLPVPNEFRLPEGWLPAAPPDGADVPDVAFAAVHPHTDAGFTANITVNELAEESAQHLREAAGPVVMVHRREVGSVNVPALTSLQVPNAYRC